MSSSRKILFVIGSLSKGGAEVQLLRLASKMKEQGMWVELFVFENVGSLREEAYNSVNKIYYGKLSSTSSKINKFFSLLQSLHSIFTLCIKKKYDVVHSFLPLANLISAVSARLAFAETIITSRRALNTHQDKSLIWKYLDQFSTLCSHKVVCNAEMVKLDTLTREGDSKKLNVVKNILDEISFGPKKLSKESLGISNETFVFVIVANLIEYKGHSYLIKALSLLALEFPNIALLVVGEDRGILTSLIELSIKENVSNKIHWVGFSDTPADYFNVSNALISSSLEEGLSNSIMEAMFCGIPVISTNVGGSAELLKFGEYGILVPPANAEELAKAMKSLILNYDTCLKNANVVASSVKSEFSSRKIVSDYLKIYNLS